MSYSYVVKGSADGEIVAVCSNENLAAKYAVDYILENDVDEIDSETLRESICRESDYGDFISFSTPLTSVASEIEVVETDVYGASCFN